MKIQKTIVKNFKAISEKEVEFGGCSVIVTGANQEGKTSLLRGLMDRFQGENSKNIVKSGEEKGSIYTEFTNGSKIEWSFTEKSEKFIFMDSSGNTEKSGILTKYGKKFFGTRFDIDYFLKSSSTEQSKTLQKLVGLDFSEIDNKLNLATENRKFAKKEFDKLVQNRKVKPVEIEKPRKTDALEKELLEIESENRRLEAEWKLKNQKHFNEINVFNKLQDNNTIINNELQNHKDYIFNLPDVFKECIDLQGIMAINLIDIEDTKELYNLTDPEIKQTSEIKKKIENAKQLLSEYDMYLLELKIYNEWAKSGKLCRENVQNLEVEVKGLRETKSKMILESKLPEGFEFSETGQILYDGFDLQDNSISLSQKYIAALKIGSMGLGEIETLYFDASTLDRKSLEKVQSWADTKKLQLLIERPDFDGGEIKIEIVEEK